MKKKIFALITAALLITAGGCSGKAVGSEIKIPILDGDSSKSYKTAEASYHDLSQNMTMAGNVEYAFADVLSIDYDTNVLEYNVKKGDLLKAGDIIAVFSSADMTYDYQNQKILADSAYSRYISSGTEAARIEYEIESERLNMIQYKIDSYTIRAPYDCIVTSTERLQTGNNVSAGTPVCSVAKPDEVYVTVEQNKERFALGTPVQLKFGSNDTFTGRVIMEASNGAGRGSVNGKVLIAFDEGELDRATGSVGNLVSAGWATVIVKVYNKHNALCIPKDAVMLYSGATYCYYANDGTRTRIPIEVGDTVDDLTIVLSGLAEGDIVSY